MKQPQSWPKSTPLCGRRSEHANPLRCGLKQPIHSPPCDDTVASRYNIIAGISYVPTLGPDPLEGFGPSRGPKTQRRKQLDSAFPQSKNAE